MTNAYGVSPEELGDRLLPRLSRRPSLADLKAELATLGVKHAALTRQREDLDLRLLAAAADAQAERAVAAEERDRLQALLRQVEDRAYGEVDRARQELKGLKAQLTAQARDHAAVLRTSEQGRRSVETALSKTQRELATLVAKRATRPSASAKTRPAAKAPSRRRTT